MDIISAYREAGTFRGAAAISGTTPKTVRRVIARHEAGGGVPPRVPRGHNYDAVAVLVTERVTKTSGRISAKRLLPAARVAGYGGSPRNFRRLVAAAKQDGANVGSLSVTANQCTCGTATPSVPACSSNYCTNDPRGNYVVVNAQAPFATTVKYPGVPSSVTLKSQAVMQVQQQ